MLTSAAARALRRQIDRLLKEQSNTLQEATYVGMTTDEAKEFEVRHLKIVDLLEQLRSSERKRPSRRFLS
jgi:hypothetical protein